MAKSKSESVNVKIPMSLLTRIICLLECWDLDDYDREIIEEHSEIVPALTNLKKSIESHSAFVQFLNDSEYDSRWKSCFSYLQRKRESELPF